MHNKINLEIKGFGLINEANIEINKINIVGGVNASGKSTASKLLYYFLKSISSRRNEFLLSEFKSFNWSKLPNFILNKDAASKEYKKYEKKFEDGTLNLEDIDNFIKFLSLDNNALSSFICHHLAYNESLCRLIDKSYYSKGEEYDHWGSARLYSNNFEISIQNKELEVSGRNPINIVQLNKEDCSDEYFSYLTEGSLMHIENVFYISPVSLLDLNKFRKDSSDLYKKVIYGSNEKYLLDSLNDLQASDDGKLTEELEFSILLIQEAIKRIIHGDISDNGEFTNEFYNSNITNTSSGVKQIGLIELLLENRKLRPGTFLIIDEPEVNLHPEWQFKFAQILVLIAKKLDVILFINSHSPAFIESIDAYTEFFDMENDINFYLTELSDNSNIKPIVEESHVPELNVLDIKPNKTTFTCEKMGITQEFTITDWDSENSIRKYIKNENIKTYNFTKINSNELYKIYNNLGNVYHLIDQLRLKKRLGE